MNGELQFSAKNMFVLGQNQTIKKFGPFSVLFDNSVKSSAPYNFFSAPFVFCGRNFGPLATQIVNFFLKGKGPQLKN
jgi:hypothetical protein